MGWVSYSGSYDQGKSADLVHSRYPSDLRTDQTAAPELTDLVRMGRRLIRRFVTAARADERVTLRSLLTEHFGPQVSSLPVVSSNWPPYEHVNVQLGLEGWLSHAGRSHRLLGVTGFQHRMFSLADLAPDPDQATAALDAIRSATVEHNVFRGQVLSFEVQMFGPDQAPISFQERPTLPREALVLPDGVLESIEAQVVGVAAHRERLLASRQHLKRGLLLHGPPGTGKTHTIRYLIGRLPEFTVVILSGTALRYVGAACSIARTLAPSMVVIEDVDLIAEQRGMHAGEHPMLFQLLNEMDGLAEDCDVTFVLTTNRADLLEPALAARPGRVDQAVEFVLPDGKARRQLLDLYRGALILDLSDSDAVVARTSGVTASFLKELLRKAALIAAEQEVDGSGAVTVAKAHLSTALDRLLDEQHTMTRVLLGGPGHDRGPRPGMAGPSPAALPDG